MTVTQEDDPELMAWLGFDEDVEATTLTWDDLRHSITRVTATLDEE